MFNKPDTDHFARVRNLKEDPLIESARVSMGVDKDPSLEKTLQWYRCHWIGFMQRSRERKRAERERERAELTQLQSELEGSHGPNTLSLRGQSRNHESSGVRIIMPFIQMFNFGQ
ncbi:hypothetical protein B0H13DRAFT_1853095 [Mycena leptocephala]|nr:hypothetical protein B0H13DRAFT_1853095 [Mycena leptocephala]